MQPEATPPRVVAMEDGIHFRSVRREDIIVFWGEIESIDATKYTSADESTFLEIYVNHFSGVDFRFHNVDPGYAEVVAAMERHLVGFSRSAVEATGTWEEKLDGAVIWQRNEGIQPYEFHPPIADDRPPTDEERVQMAAAHKASVNACEKRLGRPLYDHELACISTGFENGRILGSISPPLCNLIAPRQ